MHRIQPRLHGARRRWFRDVHCASVRREVMPAPGDTTSSMASEEPRGHYAMCQVNAKGAGCYGACDSGVPETVLPLLRRRVQQ